MPQQGGPRDGICLPPQGFIDRFGRDPRLLQLLFLSDADTSHKSCWLMPQLGGATGQSPPKFLKTCSVEYISWVRPCLLSKMKS